MDDHPVRITVDDDLRRSRLTVFFRLLLAIPHLFWIVLWSIAVFFAAIAGWFAALATTRLPEGLHNFFTAYVRYATHLGAYLSIAANPYPSFTGEPGYPVDVAIAAGEPQSRWKVALRIVLAIPALLLAAVLGWGSGGGGGGQASDTEAQWSGSSGVGGIAAVCAVLGWFAAVALGRMPLGIRNLAAYGLGYSAQAYSYALLLTDRYPNSDPDALGPTWALPAHPVTLVQDDDGRRSRLTVFFRLLLAIPHFVWIALWTVAAVFAAFANWLVALVRGRSAEPLHRFLTAYIRYSAHVSAFAFLVANPFPGFVGAPGYPVEVAFGAGRPAEPLGDALPPTPRVPGAPALGRAQRRPARRGLPGLVRVARDRTDADRPAQPRRDRDSLRSAGARVPVRRHRHVSAREPGAHVAPRS